jgi:hypothetical protein
MWNTQCKKKGKTLLYCSICIGAALCFGFGYYRFFFKQRDDEEEARVQSRRGLHRRNRETQFSEQKSVENLDLWGNLKTANDLLSTSETASKPCAEPSTLTSSELKALKSVLSEHEKSSSINLSFVKIGDDGVGALSDIVLEVPFSF